MTENPHLIQFGGNHYKQFAIEPITMYQYHNLGFCEACIIKYCMRHKDKNGLEDLRKANHYVEFLIHYNKPIGVPPTAEYIESFCRLNKLDSFMLDLLNELSNWLHYKKSEFLRNMQRIIRDEMKTSYNINVI